MLVYFWSRPPFLPVRVSTTDGMILSGSWENPRNFNDGSQPIRCSNVMKLSPEPKFLPIITTHYHFSRVRFWLCKSCTKGNIFQGKKRAVLPVISMVQSWAIFRRVSYCHFFTGCAKQVSCTVPLAILSEIMTNIAGLGGARCCTLGPRSLTANYGYSKQQVWSINAWTHLTCEWKNTFDIREQHQVTGDAE